MSRYAITPLDSENDFRRQDGTLWPVTALFEQNAILAEDYTALLSALSFLIDDLAVIGEDGLGYPYADTVPSLDANGDLVPEEDTEASFMQRVAMAINLAGKVQINHLNAAVEIGDLDPSSPLGDEMEVLTYRKDGVLGIEQWWGRAPLVLVATQYAPYTETPPPARGEQPIIWIDPSSEKAFVQSLAVLGMFHLMEAEPVEA